MYIGIIQIKPFDLMHNACYRFFVCIWKYNFGQAEPKSIKNCERWKRVRLIFGKFARRKWWPVKRNQHPQMTDKHFEMTDIYFGTADTHPLMTDTHADNRRTNKKGCHIVFFQLKL